LWEAFLDRYYPHTPPATAYANARDDAKAVAGTYTLSRRSESSFLKAASIISQFSVAPVGDGEIEVPQLTGPNGKPKRWQGVGPMTFLERGGQDKLIFKPDQNGRMQLVLFYPFFVGQKVGILQNGKFLLTVLVISLVLMLVTLLLWPISWFVRRHYKGKLELATMEKILRLGVRLVFLIDLIFDAALVGLVSYGFTHLDVFSDKGATWFRLVQILGYLGVAGKLIVVMNAIIAWMSKRRSIWGKLGATVMLLISLGVMWFVFAGGLLHFPSNY